MGHVWCFKLGVAAVGDGNLKIRAVGGSWEELPLSHHDPRYPASDVLTTAAADAIRLLIAPGRPLLIPLFTVSVFDNSYGTGG